MPNRTARRHAHVRSHHKRQQQKQFVTVDNLSKRPRRTSASSSTHVDSSRAENNRASERNRISSICKSSSIATYHLTKLSPCPPSTHPCCIPVTVYPITGAHNCLHDISYFHMTVPTTGLCRRLRGRIRCQIVVQTGRCTGRGAVSIAVSIADSIPAIGAAITKVVSMTCQQI